MKITINIAKQGHFVRQAAMFLLSFYLMLGLLPGGAVSTVSAADINIINYGAVPNAAGLQTVAIQAAIDAAGNGDRVIVPAGKFIISTIYVKSNITLYLSAGAILESSANWRDFSDPWNWRNAMIKGQTGNTLANFTIEGPGIIDGVDLECPDGEEGIRGPHTIYLSGYLSGSSASNIRIAEITIRNSGNYAIFLNNVNGLTLENLTILGGWDGFDINHSTDITLTGCDFRTSDDCIAGVGLQNVQILNSRFNSSMQGIRIGGHNVVIRDCEFYGPGEYEHRVHQTTLSRAAIHPPDWDRGQPRTPYDNCLIENCTFSGIREAYKYLKGANGFGVRGVTFNNVTVIPPENSNLPPIAIRGEEARVIINGVDFSAGSNSPTIIDIRNFDHLELHDVTLRIADDKPAIRAVTGDTVWLDCVKVLPDSNPAPFDLTSIGTVLQDECIYGEGTILREVWTNVSGVTIASLTNDPRFPASPTSSNQMTSFEAPVNWADNYGTRVRGFIHPPTTGSYTFWIASDDNSELWLSSDETVAGASQIAMVPGWTSSLQWTKFPEQQSATISLVGGQRYYIEAVHKEGTGGDNLAVAWSGPGISGPVVIAGQYLSPWTGGSAGAVVSTMTVPTAPGNLTATAINSSQINLSWADNSSNEDGFRIERRTGPGGTWGQIATVGANVMSYSNTGLSASTNYYYRVRAYNGAGNSAYSNEANATTTSATILREVWTNVSGVTIANLTTDPRFPASPTSSNQMTSFEAPVNWADNYGTRVRGFIHPPTTGSYTFWIASDDNGELWLSTNETIAGASRIAMVPGWTSSLQWTKFPEQQSAAISLVGGQRYYIEAVHKEGSGGDNLAVAWSGPGISGPVVIDGQYLSTWTGGSAGAVASTGISAPSGLSTIVSGSSQINLSWADNSNNEDGFHIERRTGPDGTWGQIATVGANVMSYSNTGLSASTNYYYRVRAYNGNGNSAYSNEANATTTSATILREVWTNVSGYTIASLTNDPRFPDSPTSSNQMTSFEAPTNWADNYGTRVRGFIHPPTTGSYTFWIASDNHGELWLSTDETVAGASQIALVWGFTSSRQWTKYPAQQSAAISLVGGQKYYIEALHKEQNQGDNLAVAWSGPGISGPVVIDGQYLSPWTGSNGGVKSATALVAINDKDFKDLLIYPNPFDAYINITLQEKAQLDLYDISGKIRLTMKLEEGLNRIPTAYLEKGFYMMKISANERVFNKLMVK